MIYLSIFAIEQDESVRLWNVETGICILIFAGAGGHRNEVLSVVCLEHKMSLTLCAALLPLHLFNTRIPSG